MNSISVVIPAYNAQRFIERTLKNLALQTLPPIEIIVVDDASEDRTAEIARQLGATVIVAQHGGPGAARNLGVAAAKGDWVAFLDADDLWHPEKLERDMLAAGCDGEVDAIVCDVDKIDEIGTVIAASTCSRLTHVEALKRIGGNGVTILDRDALEGSLAEWSFFIPSAFVIRKSALARVGHFAVDIRYGSEDVEFFLRCAAECTIAFVDASMVGYVQHGAQISKTNAHLTSQYDIASYVLAHAPKYSPAVLRMIRARWPVISFSNARSELHSGDPRAALQLLISGVRHMASEAFIKRYAFRIMLRIAILRKRLSWNPKFNLLMRRIPGSLLPTSYSSSDWKAIMKQSG